MLFPKARQVMMPGREWPTSRPLRVLMVPDHLPWITGTIARKIAEHNPWIEATIITGDVLQPMLQKYGWFLGDIDVIHLLTEWEAKRFMHLFNDRAAIVHSVHHVEDWNFISTLTAADALHVVADQWRDYMIDKGVPAERMVKLANGVNTELFKPAAPELRAEIRRELGMPLDAFAVGMFSKRTSNSSGRKAPEVFIAGVQKLAKQVPNLAALMVGPGWGDVVDDLNGRGVACSWIPFAAGDAEVCRAYQALDSYWVTSHIEGGPVPLLEAMACGLACVTTPVGVAEEIIIEGENGYIVQRDDVDGFVERTAEIAADSEHRRRMGVAARNLIEQNWQWKHVVQNALELYGLAVQNGLQRNPQLTCRNWRRPMPAQRVETTGERDQLAAVPANLREEVWAMEQVNWIHALYSAGESRVARHFGYKMLAQRPFSFAAWREIPVACGWPKISAVARRIFPAAPAASFHPVVTHPARRAPQVSVLLPIYNDGPRLQSAIESILAQTCDDIELVALNDGSTDNSMTVLRRLADRDDRIRFINRAHKGRITSLNELLAAARARYVTVMDAAATALPLRLARQASFLEQNPDVVAVGCGHEWVDDTGRLIDRVPAVQDNDDIQPRLLAGEPAMVLSTVLAHTDAVRQAGGFSDEHADAFDHDLLLRLGEIGKLANLRHVLQRLLVTADSMIISPQRAAAIQHACAAAQRRRNLQITVRPIVTEDAAK
jgi:glycosyltransferase involved in cell wall biosynthesis